MPDDAATLGSLIAEVQHNGWVPSPYSGTFVTSEKWHQQLSKQGTSVAAGHGWHRPSEADLQQLADRLVPPPAADVPSVDAVVGNVEGSIGGAGSLTEAISSFELLWWPSIWEVLDRLASRGPTLDGATYLEELERQIRLLPDVDQRLVAATICVLLRRGPRTLGSSDLPTLVRLTQALTAIDFRSQLEVLNHLGVPPEAAEGNLALMEAAAAEMAAQAPALRAPAAVVRAAASPSGAGDWLSKLEELWKSINPDDNTFLDWAKPKKMPGGLYIGLQVHEAIGTAYKLIHGTEVGNYVATNTWSVASILDTLQMMYAFRGSQLRVALAVARPDIFELGIGHGMPPGWVYEIKPWTSVALAEYEALFYAALLSMSDIPVIPGPPGDVPGTFGVIPIPGGWAAYMSPEAGVIVYKIRWPSKKALEARKQERANSEVEAKVMQELSAVGLKVAIAGALASIAAALIDYGWIFAFV